MLTVIAFYSVGTSYEEEAKILTGSLDQVGMQYVVRGYPDRGSWYANTAQKAELIQDARLTLPGPLLYIDVDAFVHANCTSYFEELASEGYDFGVHYFAAPGRGRKNDCCRCLARPYGKCDKEHRLLSGTLFFGDTPGARRLLGNWVTLNETLRALHLVEGGGQKNLWYLTTCMKELRIAKLPGRFCRVFDKPHAYPRGEGTVIEHTIASRENRGSVTVSGGRQRRVAEMRTSMGLR